MLNLRGVQGFGHIHECNILFGIYNRYVQICKIYNYMYKYYYMYMLDMTARLQRCPYIQCTCSYILLHTHVHVCSKFGHAILKTQD